MAEERIILLTGPGASPGERATVEERLEGGEVVLYSVCPFGLPGEDDREFLRRQEVGGRAHKNISYDPASGRVSGFRRGTADEAERLRRLMAEFSGRATAWLGEALPRYRAGLTADRASLRPEEEATRRCRPNARNDLLHVDAFPSRPSGGRRILRLFVNLHPSDPRVWATSEPFGAVLARYGAAVGLPGRRNGSSPSRRAWLLSAGAAARVGSEVLRLFVAGAPSRCAYDAFMLRLHTYLKRCEEFQDKAPRRHWQFPPGSAWLAMTDGCVHAELRGQYAWEHSWFVAPGVLARPELAPAALVARACGRAVVDRAA